MDKNMRAGYQGKYDSMRALADKLSKPSGYAKDVYYSKSCADKEFKRPFKEGGRVEVKEDDRKLMSNLSKNSRMLEMVKKQEMHNKNKETYNKEEDDLMTKKHDETAKEVEYKRGGAVNKRTIKRQKYAAGGVAKIRHDQMTPDGRQLGTKRQTKNPVYY